MKQHIIKILKNPLILSSGIVFFGNILANFFGFLFNLLMSRSLTVAEYGVLASLMSLIIFPALLSTAVIPMVVRFAGDYFAKGNVALLRGLYIKIKKPLLLLAVASFILFLVFIHPISNFFHIDDLNILFMTNIVIFFAIIGVINMAFLQAKLAFGFQVFVNTLNSSIKLVLGFVLVYLGYSVGGAAFAMVIAAVVGYLVSFIPLKFVFDRKITSPKISTKELFLYGFPSALTLFGLTAFITTDIILVKHFFDSHQAGLYAGLSLIARVVFYLTAPIGTVMFPMIVQKHSRNENVTSIFKLSFVLVFVPSILVTLFYAFFPEFSILFFLKKEEYLAVIPFLIPFAVFTLLYSILSILSNFYLSINKTKIFIPILIGAFLQAFFIFFFHETFMQIITISLVITFLLVCLLLLYYPYATKK